MSFRTADLCNLYAEQAHFQVAESVLKMYGGKNRFSGCISTLKVFEDSSLIRSTLEHDGLGRVLVIDGGGSRRCGLLGEKLANLALANNWEGIVVYGCVRNTEQLESMAIGVMALNTHPMPSRKHGEGNADVVITFAGVNFKKDHYLYADSDGIIVAESKLD
ncbi:MAG: ribonuclease E activity regulator RraA [Methylomonas sp.]